MPSVNNPFAPSPPPVSSLDPFGAQAEVNATSNEIWGSSGALSEQGAVTATVTSERPQSEWSFSDSSNPWETASAGGGSHGASGIGSSFNGQQNSAGSGSGLQRLSPASTGQFGASGEGLSYSTHAAVTSGPPLPRRPSSTRISLAEQPNLRPRSSLASQHTGQVPSLLARPRSPRNPFTTTPGSSSSPSATAGFGARSSAAPAPPGRRFATSSTAEQMIRAAMEELRKAHQDELFLRQLKAPPSSSSLPAQPSLPPSRQHSDEHDAVTESFKLSFPSLSRSPSPTLPPKAPLDTAVGSLATSDGFEEQLRRTANLLVWQLQQHVEAEIARGEQSWRDEKRRGMQEVEELEKELADEIEGRKKAESEVKRLERALQETTSSHNLDLEAAAKASAELSDRVDILQAALNEAAEQR